MQTLAHRLNHLFESSIHELEEAEVVPATKPQFGHYQCNSALKLAKKLGKNPREVAQSMIDDLCDSELIDKLEIAGPGFINIFLSKTFLSSELDIVAKDPRLGVPMPKRKQRVIVEYSSPNVAKALHVGHLRSTIIGDAIAKLQEFLGHNVLKLNHVGDWGTQFGMLIAYVKKHHPSVIKDAGGAKLDDLMGWYRAAKVEFDHSPAFKKESQEEVVKLQAADPDARNAWQHICEISRKAFNEIYQLLGVDLQERGESFYEPILPVVIKQAQEKGLIKESDGAKCIFPEGFYTKEKKPLPMIIQKSDGGYNYSTTDMAAFKQRFEEEKADRIIILTDNGQKLHFEMQVEVAKMMGYYNPSHQQFDHVTFGLVLAPDGTKFSTRSSDTEPLIDLLYEAIRRAKGILHERLPDLNEDKLTEMGRILGVDAVKYSDLSSNRLKDYTFSYDRMLKFEGNTAVFLLYSYVRIQSIKRRIGLNIEAIGASYHIKLDHPSEVALGLHIRQFPEALEAMDKELLPNRLCEYLYKLSELFNAFFRDCHVEGTDKQNSRLLLCDLTGRVLKQGLAILGLDTLERM